MMQQRTKIDGRDATVVYLTRTFQPVDEAMADMMKVVFDDGSAPIFAQFVRADTPAPKVA